MIPKRLHYVWMGEGKKSDLIEKCIASWRKVLPEYDIIEWNESNFDLKENAYIQQAYAKKKWAFVSDYVRLKVLYDHGGIYLDSDVEVFKSFDPFLIHGAFTGFQRYMDHLSPITAVMGAKSQHPWIEELIMPYSTMSFDSLETNTSMISANLINNHGIILNNQHQSFGKDVHIYPAEVFCNKEEDSVSCHHFDGSWLPLKSKIGKRIRKVFQ